jgi:3-dehydroquinate dehydratase II
VTRIVVLNGPNLGRLGSRDPDVYGSATLSDIDAMLASECPDGFSCDVRQTDSEAQLISWVHEAIDSGSPVIINPAAFTHYSYALRDACQMVTQAGLPLIEIHLSNPHARESFRHQSVISGVATGVIAGFGADSYLLAMTQIIRLVGH